MPAKKTFKSFTLKIPEEKINGLYANIVSVTVGPHDVLIDFGFLPPVMEGDDQEPQAVLVQRIVLTPEVAKRFLSAFQNAVLDFEKGHKELRS